MSNYSKATKQDGANNDEKLVKCISNEKCELFKCALSEAMGAKIRKTKKETEVMELPPPSKRHKIRMNRLFRESVGGSFIPYPEVDCFCEKVRSKIVVKLKINKLIDKCKKR